MDIVQVLLTVAELRGIARGRIPEQIPVMTAEAELKFFFAVGNVKLLRERFDQQLILGGAVRIMAGRAFSVLDRAVKHRLILLNQVAVAVKAKILSRFREKFFRIA